MIEIKNLSVKYKNKDEELLVLDEINITMNPGEICSIIGPSGCGKSTLLKVLAGIIKEYNGKVEIDKQPVLPSVQRIGFIPQNYGLLDWKNVYENVILGLKIKDKKSKFNEKYINDVLGQLGLKGLEARYPKQLSGGQRQRVAIARSFVLKPDLLLMDEPFSALDAITREEIQDVFLNVWKKNKVSTILVTHSVEEAVYLGKQLVILSKAPGRVIKTIENPLFGIGNLRDKEDFFKLSSDLRRIIKRDWSD